ncbi:MAG: hypothetical protein K2N89_03905 [Lachnospiraceae bacterium]|nr:hypothetical protein [Lachnospiraceae bacterium]
MKKYRILGVLAMAVVMLTGCIDSMPEMTSDQSDMVAEYAAGLLLKYSPNYNYMLVSDDELAAALNQRALEEQMLAAETQQENEEETDEEKTQEQQTLDAETPMEETSEEAVQETPVQMLVDSSTDLVMELGLAEQVSLRYQSFEICDSYPKDAKGYSGIDAAEGKKLLVMHFDLENDTADKVDCQLFDYSMRLRVTINDSVTRSAEDTTLLPDDMLSYSGTLETGEITDVIAIAQIEEMSDSDIASLIIQISSSDSSCSIKIR